MWWGCCHPYDPWNCISIFCDSPSPVGKQSYRLPVLYLTAVFEMQTAQLFTCFNHSWHNPVGKAKGKRARCQYLLTIGVGACLHLCQGCKRGSWGPYMYRWQLLIQATFFPQNLSRGEDLLQTMTLMVSNPKQIPPASCISSGKRCRFLVSGPQ